MSLRVAIVGSGPAGLYASADLLKRAPEAKVELFDRLPTPGGLVRSGVSPDHAARRQVVAVYERLLASSGRFRLHGNVEIGRDLSHAELLANHHAVVYASGASSDRHLDIAGEDLPGSHAATEFVGWYNGHPDFADRLFDLSTERAVVIGNGNVALDVARILLMSPAQLIKTDIAEHALAALSQSRVREVVILGRRGPAQAAFTFPELMELEGLADVNIVVEATAALLADPPGANPLRLQMLREYAAASSHHPERPRRLVLRFLGSPTEILGKDRVEALRIVRNELVTTAGAVAAKATREVETLDCGLVFRSIGYRATALPGLPFDEERGVVPNTLGRVIDPATRQPLAGTYVAGWLKRGPSGVIGTNRQCSQQTIAALLEDAVAGRLSEPASRSESLDALLAQRQPRRVDYRAWKRIDRAEIARGAEHGRPRINFNRLDALLEAARL